MEIKLESEKIFIANKPIDFRKAISESSLIFDGDEESLLKSEEELADTETITYSRKKKTIGRIFIENC